jgi:hypothetical protein
LAVVFEVRTEMVETSVEVLIQKGSYVHRRIFLIENADYFEDLYSDLLVAVLQSFEERAQERHVGEEMDEFFMPLKVFNDRRENLFSDIGVFVIDPNSNQLIQYLKNLI